jgi:hypothetical protein
VGWLPTSHGGAGVDTAICETASAGPHAPPRQVGLLDLARGPGRLTQAMQIEPKKRRGVGLSEECVTGGITDRISLRLDGAPAEPAVIDIMDDYFAKQVARQMHAVRHCGAPAPPESGWTRWAL